jgi:uncharacterized membrane protein YoaK (UPF0700 family)
MTNSNPLYSPNPVERRQMGVAMSTSLLAGYLDAYALVKLGIYVSFMSGNTVMLGVRTGEAHFITALAPLVAVIFYFLGSFSGAYIATFQKPYPRRFLFFTDAILICVVYGLTPIFTTSPDGFLKLISIGLLCCASGLLNPTLSHVGGETVSLTFVTGSLTRTTGHLAQAVRHLKLSGALGPWDTHLHRAVVDLSLWVGFFIGAILSGLLMKQVPPFALPVAIAIAVTLGLVGRAADDAPAAKPASISSPAEAVPVPSHPESRSL